MKEYYVIRLHDYGASGDLYYPEAGKQLASATETLKGAMFFTSQEDAWETRACLNETWRTKSEIISVSEKDIFITKLSVRKD